MEINVIGRLKGYAYAEGLHDMPKEHAQKFLDAGKGNLPESEKPNSSNTKKQIQKYLDDKGIDYDSTSKKYELLALI